MKRPVLLAIALGVAAIVVLAVVLVLRPSGVDLLLINGKIYTVDDRQPLAEAVAIRGEGIVGVGTTQDLLRRFAAVRTVDLHGRTVTPGFIDAHAHLEGLGVALSTLDLAGRKSRNEIAGLVREESGRHPVGVWIRGRGWDQNLWEDTSFPTHEILDEGTTQHPVYLVRVDGHAVWVNALALRLAGITAATPDPPGGRILRDARGEPTGVFVDNAVDLLVGALPAPGVEERRRLILRAVEECLRLGLTEVHDMGVDSTGLDIYRTLIAEGKLALRVYAVADGTGSGWREALRRGPEENRGGGRLTVRAVKFYADGALGSRGAALIDPYSDDPENRGLTVTAAETLKAAVQVCLQKGFQVCTHAIGDRANTIVLSVYENVFHDNGVNGPDLRFRIEHAQVLDPGDFSRFHRAGIIPSMQPSHCTSDMPWAPDRLGSKRIAGAYAWRSLLNEGNIIPAGSDFPVENPNPILGFYAAVTRQRVDGTPPEGWQPAQRMTRQEALKAYTLWGAVAGFQERWKGTLEEGKWADLTVFSDDLMSVPAGTIPAVEAVLTVVAGRIVYAAPAFASPGASP